MEGVFGFLKSGLELAAALKKFASSKKASPRLNGKISRALRGIYFTPNGVLTLLKEIEAGVRPNPERIQAALIEFNDKEWAVRANLQELEYERLKDEFGLTLGTIRKLENIRFGKLNLRREIQSEINYYCKRGVAPNNKKVAELIALIERLNFEIEDIERCVNVGASER